MRELARERGAWTGVNGHSSAVVTTLIEIQGIGINKD